VTIAAAMRCQGGIILCSDSLISGGDVNNAQPKIIPFNVPALKSNVVVAYAGTVSHCWSAIDHFARRLNKIPASDGPLTEERFKGELADVMVDFYNKHMFNHRHYGYQGGPGIQLIAVLQNVDEKLTSIFATSETVVNGFSDYVFVGSGESIARYIVEPLIVVSLPTMQDQKVLLLADHMLHQVKRFVPGCGDVSQFFFVSNWMGFCHPAHEPLLPEERSDTFRRIFADLFYASADLDMDDDLVNIGFHLTDKRIKEIRNEQRSERERRKQLGPKLFTNPLLGLGPTVEKYKPKR
jgi:ATP-dependent protease HslVU (ClpYQ) peptidase subunit